MAAGSIVQSRYEDDALKLLGPPKLAKSHPLQVLSLYTVNSGLVSGTAPWSTHIYHHGYGTCPKSPQFKQEGLE